MKIRIENRCKGRLILCIFTFLKQAMPSNVVLVCMQSFQTIAREVFQQVFDFNHFGYHLKLVNQYLSIRFTKSSFMTHFKGEKILSFEQCKVRESSIKPFMKINTRNYHLLYFCLSSMLYAKRDNSAALFNE